MNRVTRLIRKTNPDVVLRKWPNEYEQYANDGRQVGTFRPVFQMMDEAPEKCLRRMNGGKCCGPFKLVHSDD